MVPDAGLAAWVRLTLVPGLGGQGLRRLLAEFGLPERVIAAKRAALARHVGEQLAERILADGDTETVERTLAWAASTTQAAPTAKIRVLFMRPPSCPAVS